MCKKGLQKSFEIKSIVSTRLTDYIELQLCKANSMVIISPLTQKKTLIALIKQNGTEQVKLPTNSIR